MISLLPCSENVERNVSMESCRTLVSLRRAGSVSKLNFMGSKSGAGGVKKNPLSPLNIKSTSAELGVAVSEVPSFRARQPGAPMPVSYGQSEYKASPREFFGPAKTFFKTSTCCNERHASVLAPWQASTAGSKRHALVSKMSPSFTPSCASQASATALLSRVRSLFENALDRIGRPAESFGAISENAMVSHTELMVAVPTRAAGATDNTPSNSSGKRCAARSACPPPLEQPMKYDFFQGRP